MSKDYEYFFMVYRKNRKNKAPQPAYYQALKTCRKRNEATPSYKFTIEHERKKANGEA